MTVAPNGGRGLRALVNVVPLRARRTGVGRCLEHLVEGLGRGHPEVALGFFDGWRVRASPPGPDRGSHRT